MKQCCRDSSCTTCVRAIDPASMRGNRMMPTGNGTRRPQTKGSAVLAGLRMVLGWLVPGLQWLLHRVTKLACELRSQCRASFPLTGRIPAVCCAGAVRFFTKRGEMERILTSSPHHSRAMTEQFKACVGRTKQPHRSLCSGGANCFCCCQLQIPKPIQGSPRRAQHRAWISSQVLCRASRPHASVSQRRKARVALLSRSFPPAPRQLPAPTQRY